MEKVSKSFYSSRNSFVENSRNNLEKSESTVYFNQDEEEEDDTNFVVVSTLVRVLLYKKLLILKLIVWILNYSILILN